MDSILGSTVTQYLTVSHLSGRLLGLPLARSWVSLRGLSNVSTVHRKLLLKPRKISRKYTSYDLRRNVLKGNKSQWEHVWIHIICAANSLLSKTQKSGAVLES